MQRVGLLLLGMVSLVASGVIMERGGRVDPGMQTVWGIKDTFAGANVLTRDELLRQKFILDILHQIYAPLQQQDLLMLDDRNIITNENLYMRPLTQEMQIVLDLINANQMLSKQDVWTIYNEQHVLQAVGFYRLLVTARDFDTFQRLAVYGRKNINTEMFVHCLVLALGERQDTQMLIVPALHEIVPQLFVKDQVIDQVHQLDTGVSSIRPQLLDVMGQRNLLWNSRIADENPQGGLFDILNKSQLWMPWRELHKQISLRKVIGGNVVQQDDKQVNRLTVSLPGSGLLSQDIRLKSYVSILIDELLFNQDKVRNSNRNQIGDENVMWGNRGQMTYGGIRGNRADNERFDTLDTERLWNAGRQGMDIDNGMDRNRVMMAGRRFGKVGDENDWLMGGRRYENRYDIDEDRNMYMRRDNNMEEGQRGINTVSANDARLLFVGRRRQNPNNVVNMGGNRYDEDDLISGGRSVVKEGITDERQKSKYYNDERQGGKYNTEERQGGKYYNDERQGGKYFTDERQGGKYYNDERQGGKYYNDERQGSKYYNDERQGGKYYNDERQGGKYFTDERQGGKYYNDERQGGKYYNDERQGSKYYNDERQGGKYFTDERQGGKYYKVEPQGIRYYNDDDVAVNYLKRIENDRYMNTKRQGMMMNINNDEEDLMMNNNQQISDSIKRNYGGRIMGNGRDDFLNMMTGGRMAERQSFQNDHDFMYNRGWTNKYNGESLGMNLPTTDINDERLLHIKLRKLNNDGQERYVNDIDEDMNERYNTGFQRDLDVERNWDMIRRDNTEARDTVSDYYRGDKQGLRTRRSIVNQEQDQYMGQTETINGRLLLHSLQQLVARLNIERIALGQPQLIDNTQTNFGRGIPTNNLVRNTATNALDQIERIIQQIDNAMQQQIGEIYVSNYNQMVNEIGLMLAGQIRGLGLTDILGDVLEQTNPQQRKGLVANLLENEAAQILLARIVRMVDRKVQQVFRQREEFISTVQGVNINNVEVGKLQTYLEESNIDLTNLLNYNNKNIDQTKQGNQKVVVGRMPRLNHREFNVKIDVTSDRQQQVVVRNLLVPRIDGQNNMIPMMERRQNVIVLDITTVELQQGRNTLKLKSNDITMTSRDTTPLTKIYQVVMQALNGDMVLQRDLWNGQSTLLPHHLLLPRGRTNGLPMQLITVITPMQSTTGVHRDNGWNTLLLDNLPLNYPLHCDITDLDRVNSMPNLMIQDVKIYHEDSIKMPFMY